MELAPGIIRKIAKATDLNDHGGALMVAAQALEAPQDLIDGIARINAEHERSGSLSLTLYHQRRELSQRMFAFAKEKLSPASYSRLYRAF